MRALTMTVVVPGFLIAALLAGLFGTFLADRDPPISIISAEVLTPMVRPGDPFTMRFKVVRHRSCAIHADRVLRDSAGGREILEDFDLKTDPGPIGNDSFLVHVTVPAAFKPGPAHYITAAEFACNVVHKLWPIRAPVREFTFEIVGR